MQDYDLLLRWGQDLGGRADELGFRSRTPLDEVLRHTLGWYLRERDVRR